MKKSDLLQLEEVSVPRQNGEVVANVRGDAADSRDPNPARMLDEATQSAYLTALIENNPLGIVVIGQDSRVQMCNPAFERLFQYPQAEVLGSHLDRLIVPEAHAQEASELSRRAATGEIAWAITRRRRRDGSSVDVQVTAVPLIVNGRQIASFGMYEDITRRKIAERGQHQAEARLRSLFENAVEGIFQTTPEGKYLSANPALARIFGYGSPKEMAAAVSDIGKQLYADPGRREEFKRLMEQQNHIADFEYELIRKDGSRVWINENAHAVRDPQDKILYYEGTVEDITARKRAESALREAEERYRSIFENAVEGIFQTTPDGRYLCVNPALSRMCGYASPEEHLSAVNDIATQEYVNPQLREEFKRRMEESGRVEAFEYQFYRKDGTKAWVSEHARAVRGSNGEVLFYEGTTEDITARKRDEAERQATLEIIHSLNVTENLDDLLNRIHTALKKVIHAENCFVALHDPATGMFHFPFFVDQYDTAPPPQLVGKTCTDYIHRNNRAMLIPQPVFDQLAAQGEVELVGTPSPSWLGVPLRTPTATIGVLVVQHYEDPNAYTERDLEFLSSVGGQIAVAIERKRGESALRDSEARLRVLVQQLPAILWTVDPQLRFTSSLGAGLARIGFSPQDIIGKTMFDFFETRDESFMPIAAHRRATAGEPVTFHMEWRAGSYTCHTEPLRGADGSLEGAICMALDVSDRKKLEEQLRQAQKMEAVGRLAGGIAHDFNNLLMVIQGYAELLIDKFKPGEPLRRNAEQIQEASQRATSLTRQLLAFSRKQMLAPSILNVQSVVTDMEKILRRLIGEDIELVTVNAPDLWRIRADRTQIEQVILNLAVNARDAMPRGGKLTIESANVEFDNSYAHAPVMLAPGQYVMLAVTDNGCGMDAETKAHAFEPFFTTKEKSKGTGLGLATVYGIVKQSGGYVWVYSEPGQGTTFKVYLPRVDSEELVARERPEVAQDLPRGSETILLVEDEPGVRDLAREYLETSGYQVLVSEDGAAALKLASEHTGEIDLLMTDVVMPGMSGCNLAERIAAVRPGIRVVYMSGYTDQAIVHHGILDSDVVLLQKPFTMSTLAHKLREAFSSRAR